jgi:hypothetical protein
MSESLYDPVANPYAPGAGTPPPALVGRDGVITDVDLALQRIRAGRSAQHQLITGLRGVGKTVLLGALAAVAESRGYRIIRQEAIGGPDTLVSFLRQAQRITEDLGAGERVRRAMRSIDAVRVSIAGTGVELQRDAPMPDREALADVVVDLGAAAASEGAAVMIAIDEAQLLDPHDLRRILSGVHRCGQDGLPVHCLLAGLPNLLGVVARAATYAERMFTTADLGPLTPAQVGEAVTAPAAEIGVQWDADAVGLVTDRSDGYPFFVQVWAYHTWNTAADDPISTGDVERATPAVRQALDSSFFAARLARIPDSEVAYVRAMASLGAGPHRSGEVASAMGRATSQVSALRDRLIDEGLLFSPRYGWVEFAIPHFEAFVARALPES